MFRSSLAALLLVVLAGTSACSDDAPSPVSAVEASTAHAASALAGGRSFAVSGGATHFFTTAVIHSNEPDGNGMIQRSTDVIRLTGDLDGFILYHPTSVFDFDAGTLVNTGSQIFSGTVQGSEPLLLHDDTYRFEVDLSSGATAGEVHLGRSLDAPHRGLWFECDLEVVGTGFTPEGDGLAEYTGTCTEYGRATGTGGA
jgi:hypothetical protein